MDIRKIFLKTKLKQKEEKTVKSINKQKCHTSVKDRKMPLEPNMQKRVIANQRDSIKT